MDDLLRLSVSKTKTFIGCKRKYKFIYIDKLPRKTWDFHIFGIFCHKVLEDFHNTYIESNDTPYNVTMSKVFKDALLENKDKMTPEMKKECWGLINYYLKLVTENKKNKTEPKVLSCEKEFELAVGGKVILNGMIDKVQIDADNVLHVCDYKTTKKKEYLAKDFFQLLTYAYIMINDDPSLKKVRASYILLRHNFESITAEFNKDEILKVADKYIDYTDKIIAETEYKPNPTPLCKFCEHVELCPEGKKMVEKLEQRNKNNFGQVSW
jgi:putative RecB family exonuclease